MQTLPTDLSALVSRCSFCGQENPLPTDALALRTEQVRLEATREAEEREIAARDQTQKRASRTVIILVGFAVVLPVVGALLIALLVSRGASDAASAPVGGGTSARAPVSVATASKPPPDPHSTGAEQMTARLKNLYALGCKNVIMPPSEAIGVRSLQADFVVNGTCVRMLAINGVPENTLTLTMKTPFGESIATPGAAAEVDFTYCPKTPGPHPTTITPAIEDDPYTVAAVECPASLSKPKR